MNPFAGFKIISYDVYIKTDLGWALMHRGKLRRSAEYYLKTCGLRGQFRFSRERWVDGACQREDVYEIARS